MTNFEQFRKQPRHDGLDYANMLRNLLPPGKIWGYFLPSEDDVIYDSYGDYEIWNDDPSSLNIINDTNVSASSDNSSWLGKLMMVIGEELARFEQRSFTLLDESVPGLSVELIDNYRYQYTRDQDEEALVLTDEDAQRFAHGKEFDASVPFTAINAEAYALTLGFVVNVIEGTTAASIIICGVGRCDSDERCGSRGVFSTIIVEIISGTANYELLQDQFDNLKPAHVVLVWDDQR